MPQDEQIFLLKKKKGVPKWVQVILVLVVSVFGVLITIVFSRGLMEVMDWEPSITIKIIHSGYLHEIQETK